MHRLRLFNMLTIGVSAAFSVAPVLAADLTPYKAPAPPPPAWSGFYAGLNVGYGWGTSSSAQTTGIPLVDNIATDPFWGTPYGFTAGANSGRAGLNPSGIIGGVQAGYNVQWAESIIAGIEVDIQGAGISGSGGTAGVARFGPDASGLTDTAAGGGGVSSGIDWLGTARARVGYLATPGILVYATGGLAYGGVTTTQSSTLAFADSQPFTYPTFGGTAHAAATRVGWTVGGGGEWLFAPGWSVKTEALYYNLGSATFNGAAVGATDPDGTNTSGGVPGALLFASLPSTRITYDGVIVRAGVNYHFNGSAPAPAPAADTAPSWTGLYGGLNAGYGWGTSGTADTTAIPLIDNLADDPFWLTPAGFTAAASSGGASLSPSGFVGGVQVGYNYQWSANVVAGVEADIQGAGISGSGSYAGVAQYGPDASGLVDTATGAGTITASIDWLGTVRARAGYLMTPGLLLYATGGLAYGGVSASAVHTLAFADSVPYAFPTFGGVGGGSQTRMGWTAGGGGEWLLGARWSLKAEALYYNLGSESFAASPVGAIDPEGNSLAGAVLGATMFANVPVTRVTYDGVIVRAGVNYRFN
ncbi:outer membrane protein [Xanthobacter agilis]|uniref:Opacity protein-like surface antigen n=1 Tax=Xanthobacter agilis TaxID=47492 RepID=A0ABU0L833_XANAG|nr:opacity protein-like surface antigen [Xanthobacter agilis]